MITYSSRCGQRCALPLLMVINQSAISPKSSSSTCATLIEGKTL